MGMDRELKYSNDVEIFFKNIFQKINQGIFVTPQEILAESKNLNLPLADLLLGILHPLLWQIGQYFSAGEISVQKEHLFSMSIQQTLSTLTPAIPDMTDRKNGVLLFTADENSHTIGLEFLLRLIIGNGVPVVLLKTPPLTLQQYLIEVGKYQPRVIGVSIALPEQMNYVEKLFTWRDENKPHSLVPEIMVGGPAAPSVSSSDLLNNRVYVSDPYDTKATLEKILQIYLAPIEQIRAAYASERNSHY